MSQDITGLKVQPTELTVPASAETPGSLGRFVFSINDIGSRLEEATSFVHCLTAQNMQDLKAAQWQTQVIQLQTQYRAALAALGSMFMQTPDRVWDKLLTLPELAPMSFSLNEMRRQAAQKLPPEQEALAESLAADGYHGWYGLYNTVVAGMSVPFREGGQTIRLSVGQANNKKTHPDRDVRRRAHAGVQAAWAGAAPILADTLNHLAGFRLNLCRHQGSSDILEKSLEQNRMSRATLEAMWDTTDRNRATLGACLQRKAHLLGLERLSVYDLWAPLGGAQQTMTYDAAAEIIISSFARFSSDMGRLAYRAFAERWVDAEDRPGKRPGGFSTPFHRSQQSRICTTFDGYWGRVSIIAHELGHAYHDHATAGLPHMLVRYPETLGETASILAERIVLDAAIRNAANTLERIALLEDRVARSISRFMNMRAKFLFESRFYDARQQGLLTVEDLKELAIGAQQEAYGGALAEYDPYVWAGTIHYYLPDIAFYNFPYTFGYLFSSGIYARALQEGPDFAERYVALLRDSGRMTVEDLAMKYLGTDLTQPEFWQSAVDVAVADAREFLQLTK